MLSVSMGFKKTLLEAFAAMFNGGAFYLYDGARPSSASLAPPTEPVGIVTANGLAWNPSNTYNGVKFTKDGPYVYLDTTVPALITPLGIGGTARWFRLVGPGDDGNPSFAFPRVDGDIGLKAAPHGEEMLLDTNVLTPGLSSPLGYFLYTIPPIEGA